MEISLLSLWTCSLQVFILEQLWTLCFLIHEQVERKRERKKISDKLRGKY